MEQTLEKNTNKKKISLPKFLNFLKDKNSIFYYFIFLLVLGVAFFSIALFSNGFTTPFSGDYVAQQFAFYTNGYDDWWHFFKTGEFILYDENTFLGANNIGSNTFYYLFNPFFLPILIFPRQFVPQGMAILTILKMALAGLSFYYYMSYLGVRKSTAKISGLIYTFSGWISWYLWFNHFTEIAICFPLILLGIEKVLKEKNPVILGASIFLLGLTNYFFLATLILCAFVYAMWRYFQRLKLNNTKDNLLILLIGFLAFLSGLMMSMIIVLPSIMVALSSSRADTSGTLSVLIDAAKRWDFVKVFSFLFSWQEHGETSYRHLYPFIEFFYPVMSDRGTPLIKLGNETYDNVAGSIYCYSPMIILLVPALISSFKKKQYSHIVAAILFLIGLTTPSLYYIFHGFTQAYSRWTLFVTTSLIAYVSLYLDDIKNKPNWHILVGGVFALLGTIIGATCASIIVNNYSDFSYRYDLTVVLVLTLLYDCAIVTLIYLYKDKKYFERILTGVMSVEALIMGVLTIVGHGLSPYGDANNGLSNNNSLHSLVIQTEKNDKSYYRSVSSLSDDRSKNDGMRNGFNSPSTFHSIYNYNLIDFLDWVKLTNTGREGWSASYLSKSIGLDVFLGVKYRYVLKDYLKLDEFGNYDINVPLGYVDISNQYDSDKWFVFENTNHINFAFTYDSVAKFNNEDNLNGAISKNVTFGDLYAQEQLLQNALFNYEDYEEIKNEYPHFTYTDISDIYPSPSGVQKYHNVVTYRRHTSKTNNLSSLEEIVSASNAEIISKPTSNDERNIVMTIEHPSFEDEYDPTGNIIYLNIPYYSNHKVDVFLLDENDNLITYDRHNDDKESRKNTRKKLRAFYIPSSEDEFGNFVPAPKLKKIVIAPRYSKLYSDYPMAIGKYSTFLSENIQEQLDYKIENVTSKTNKYSFTTNFDSERIICTQLAYEKGFQIKAIDENNEVKYLKPYLTNGGFLGFVSLKGETKYEISYKTPFLFEGGMITLGGLFIYLTSNAGYYLLSYKKKKKELNSL